VSNQMGTVTSLEAALLVTTCTGGGKVWLNNSTAMVNAPFFDTDGGTKLAGPGYVAQMYAGSTNNLLRAVGATAPFRSGAAAGYFSPATVVVPDIAASKRAYVQVRTWEVAKGQTYEEARARGGKFGATAIYAVTLNATPTGVFVPITSVTLRAGLPLFVTGVLSMGGELSDGTIQWSLTGSPGFVYVVEKQLPPQDWFPLLLLTNTIGVSTFTDPNQSSGSVNFYRSRILD